MIIRELKIPVKATPQDPVYRMCLALKKPELDACFVDISPVDWAYAKTIAVTFQFEGPGLGRQRDTKPEKFKSDFNIRFPVFVETDGACAGNQEKRSPGG
jgi:hypothetical protein